jgi:phosphoribosylglycinamide formyltransferase 1
MKRIVILISGRGSNMQAIVQRCAERGLAGGSGGGAVQPARRRRPGLRGGAGHRHRGGRPPAAASREAFDAALAQAIDAHRPDLLVLAGFMRVLGEAFVRATTAAC